MSFEPPLSLAELLWRDFSIETRVLLENKLDGLYGLEEDERAFDSLVIDKQQALLILAQRLDVLGLWRDVLCIENVYGEGGVGLNFIARTGLLRRLRRRADFTTRFATHRDTLAGFLEKGRGQAVLHFLYHERKPHRWGVHFDLYSPFDFPFNAWRHLWWEKILGRTPNWQLIQAALNEER